MRFESQVIVVTGGGGGIGRAVCRQLGSEGAQVVVVDMDVEAAERTVEEVEKNGGLTPLVVNVDIADSPAVARSLSEISATYGQLDGVVNCAGVRMVSRRIVEVDDEQWESVTRANLWGAFVVAREAARVMSARGAGSIVMIASLSGQAPRMGQSAYCISKAGVLQLTRVLALELSGIGVRVNSVSPGVVNTPMMALSRAQDGEQVVESKLYGSLKDFRVGIPLRRVAEPEDVSSAVLYLLSSEARHVTGQNVFVDGGESIV